MNFRIISEKLKSKYECDAIYFDFIELEDKVIIHKVFYRDNTRVLMQPTSYSYEELISL
jgi:hypothetical protein